MDKIIFDTHQIEPGQTIKFLREDYTIKKGEHFTNMQISGMFSQDQTYRICGVALRLLNHTCFEEEPLLDHFMIKLYLGDKPYGPYPGNVCSTFRTIYDYELKDDKPVMHASHLTLPGYVLLRPMIVPVRMGFHLEVSASPQLPKAVVARAKLFGLFTRDVC